MAVYHGNMDMIKMLQAWQLIKPQHFPQAFREAANAGIFVAPISTSTVISSDFQVMYKC